MFEMLIGCEGTINFIDDIAIAGTDETHDKRLEKVLQVLKANNATLNESKCSYGLSEIRRSFHPESSDQIRAVAQDDAKGNKRVRTGTKESV